MITAENNAPMHAMMEKIDSRFCGYRRWILNQRHLGTTFDAQLQFSKIFQHVSAPGCEFNRSMQHNDCTWRKEC
ncbi:hypothetical protein, partial [Delftia tsuruhatensis]|uniref:hypothetical protein n=1 Tax=Delftia tsuruhatensis TaxID=180282 RepID=UPI002027740B